MFKNLEIFQVSHAMAVHAATRQSAVAQNIANADTPGYVAKDVAPFMEHMKPDSQGVTRLRATRDSHLNGQQDNAKPAIFETKDKSNSPNGNAVSLEEEMLKAVEVKRQHERALAIYKSSLDVLRASLGRR
jgi:flagellar basal-body rod protein FlgB